MMHDGRFAMTENRGTPAGNSGERSQNRFTSGPAIVLYLAAAKVLLHLLTASRYGIFRDELYYLACAEHLDWGYVDQPPLIALITWLVTHLFGHSLLALRLLPALAGGGLVWLTGRLAREMGGDRFAQTLAALAVLVVPIYLVLHHLLTMNAFEPLIWMAVVWSVVRAISSNNSRYWLCFGVLAGVGMENKYTMAFLIMGVVFGLVVTPERRFLKSRWFWFGAVAASLIFLPNLLWLIKHDFPFLELMHNIRESGRDVARGPLAFIIDQAMLMNPVLFPLWLGGLVWLLFGRNGRRYRVLGWTYVFMLVLFIALKGKNYYLAPAYAMLFAAGSVAFEQLTNRRTESAKKRAQRFSSHTHLIRVGYVLLIVLAGVVIAPIAMPLLSPDTYIRYQKAIGLEPPKAENQATGPLPQYFADEFGWEDMVREVARVYNSLPPDERARTAIFANSYGQAGAIDFFGPKYGLPKAVSTHQNYWYWGPRDYTGEIVIVLGSDGEGDREHFKSVDVVGRSEHPYSRRDEHYPILLCRGLAKPLKEIWPREKKWN
jgi:hypothetical protein